MMYARISMLLVSGLLASCGGDDDSCTIAANADGTSTITCADGTTVSVGQPDDTCTVAHNSDGTSTITCDDGTTVTVGSPDDSCTITHDANGTSTITCDDGTTVTVGGPDDSCTIAANGDGTSTITCADGTTVTVGGRDDTCTIAHNANGTSTIVCSDGTSVTVVTDAGTPAPDAGTSGTTGTTGGSPDLSGCVLDVSGTPSATLSITHLGLPSGAGFNLDGINNSAATGGATVAGCGRSDSTGGVDNALGSIAATLAGLIDLSVAFQDSLVHTVPDGGTEGSLEIDFELFGLDPGANDSCVSVRVTTRTVGGSDRVWTGVGVNVNNVLEVYFSGVPLVLDVAPSIPDLACTNQLCNPGAVLPITLRGTRARLNLNAGHTALNAGTLLGGYVFFEDCTGGTVDLNGVCQGGTYAAVNPTGFKQAVSEYAVAVNLDYTFQTMLVEAFRAARDLHMEPDGFLSPCTGANNSSTNKNTFSVAFAIDSL